MRRVLGALMIACVGAGIGGLVAAAWHARHVVLYVLVTALISPAAPLAFALAILLGSVAVAFSTALVMLAVGAVRLGVGLVMR